MKKNIRIFTDGGSRGNPGPAAYGVVIYEGENVLHEEFRNLGIQTNNVAEYQGIIAALSYMYDNQNIFDKDSEIQLYSDSLLLVNQIKGIYKTKNPGLKKLLMQVLTLLTKIPAKVVFSHIPREENSHADALVNKALDQS